MSFIACIASFMPTRFNRSSPTRGNVTLNQIWLTFEHHRRSRTF